MHDHDDHPHDHDHDHSHVPSAMALRVKALESLLYEQKIIDPAAVDAALDYLQNVAGPRNGARMVARAWTDPDYHALLMADGTAAMTEMEISGWQGGNLIAVENSAAQHNLVVCTLCSCYPVPVLGLPPAWYKSVAYRARAVKQPRAVLKEFGVTLPEGAAVRVWDSTAENRYLVVPQRPAGTEGWSAEALEALVTRDSMIGADLLPPQPEPAP